MRREELKDILQSNYSLEKWLKTLQFLSGTKNLLTLSLEPKVVEIKSAKAKEIVIEVVQLGTLKTTDGITLPIFDVTLQNGINIEYNRVGVNDLLKTHILKDAIKGAIVTFHYNVIASEAKQSQVTSKTEWRFSFISKFGSDYFAEVESIETNPKKYTYIFGTPEEHRTAIERLYNLEQSRFRLEDFFEAFNVEPVSNTFFKEYKNFYLDFVEELSKKGSANRAIFEQEKSEDIDKDIRNFVKRLLGRLVFLYFLQKKNWLGATNKNYDDGDTNFLYNLFNYNNDSKDHFYSKWLSKLFFNALNTPNRKNDGFELPNGTSVWIPFLNGGLFEEHQEPQKHREIQFSPTLFDLLFKFFNGYNFTIYENSPEDHTVAVDPEMLGHIFENLLEDNKDKGAFYTPKEIVHYMTQESLIEYLKTHLTHSREAIENLIKNHATSNFTRDDLKEVEKLIDRVKICDPAIGSGAFPMGLLQEIFGLKAVIHYELGYTVWSPAKIKQDIIQNSIYGVDLEEGAVDIARLRFWLSLVVDEPTPKPLPNLDYKIMQGNSLLESYEGIDLSKVSYSDDLMIVENQDRDLFGNLKDDQLKITYGKTGLAEKIQKLINEYFNADVKRKPIIKSEINIAIKEHIDYNLELRENQLSRLLIDIKTIKTPNVKEKKTLEKLEGDYSKLNEIKVNLEGIQLKDEKPYFLWHLFFADVFKKGGFDIVIGNPPYIQLQKNGGYLANLYKDEKFETFERTGDIYSLFYEKGINVLKEKGVLTYITSNKWMRSGYGESLRNFFSINNPKLLLDLGSGIFESATVDTNILIIEKESNKNELQAITINDKREILNLKQNDFSIFKNNSTNLWNIISQDEIFIKKQIEKIGTPLIDWNIQINRGLTTGFNDAFIIDSKKRNELISLDSNNNEIIKPILRGRDVKRYFLEQSNLWIINTHNGYVDKVSNVKTESIDIEKYPFIKEHLNNYISELTNRQDKGKTIYNLRNCSYLEEFEKEKIIFSKASKEQAFFLDSNKNYLQNTAYLMTGNYLKYLLSVLNSKIIKYCFTNFYQSGGIDGEITIQAIRTIPIPQIEDYRKELLETLVSLIIFIKSKSTSSINDIVKNGHISNFFEEVIDGCVFELYFEEHMKEKGINIIDDVKSAIEKSDLANDFENLDEEVKKQKIWELYKEMSTGTVQVKMTDFITKSPDILKPILQS